MTDPTTDDLTARLRKWLPLPHQNAARNLMYDEIAEAADRIEMMEDTRRILRDRIEALEIELGEATWTISTLREQIARLARDR